MDRLETVKGHGLTQGARFTYHGRNTREAFGTRVELSKDGAQYVLTSVMGPNAGSEVARFAPVVKFHADMTVEHFASVSPRKLDNGDTVYVGACEHGWQTGYHVTEADALAVALGHGEVTRDLYVAPVAEVTGPGEPVWQACDGAMHGGRHVFILGRAIVDGAWEYEIRDFDGNGHSPRSYVPCGELSPWAPVAEVEHAYGRTRMLCGAPIDLGRGTTRMEWVTCEPCKAALYVSTVDGFEVTDGLAVWDYDLNAGRVDISTMTSDGWFSVNNASGERMSLMNGVRVTTVHPTTGRKAADALVPVAEVDQFDPIEIPTDAEVDAMAAEHDAAMNAWAEPLIKALSAPDLTARRDAAFDAMEGEIWAGTERRCVCGLKRPIRTLMGKRARRAAKRALRAVKAGA